MARIVPNRAAFRKPKLIQLVVHRGDGKRFVVRADEKLTAFVELESAICRQNGITAMHGAGSRLKLRT
jgi:hypothetical protein